MWKKLAKQFIFDIYTVEDIEQEIQLYILEIRQKYNYNDTELYQAVRNRLFCFKRNKLNK